MNMHSSTDKVKTYIQGKMTPEYCSWQQMLKRCYSPAFLRSRPTYQGCTVHPSWHDFQTFALWYEASRPTTSGRFQLDKDLLKPGNRVYGPKTCVFVTHRVNSLFTDSGATRGALPLGVSMHRTKFKAFCRGGKGNSIRKAFKTLDEALDFYWDTKFRIVFDAATEVAETDVLLAEKIVEYFFYFMDKHRPD